MPQIVKNDLQYKSHSNCCLFCQNLKTSTFFNASILSLFVCDIKQLRRNFFLLYHSDVPVDKHNKCKPEGKLNCIFLALQKLFIIIIIIIFVY